MFVYLTEKKEYVMLTCCSTDVNKRRCYCYGYCSC